MASKMVPAAEWQRIKEGYRFYLNDSDFDMPAGYADMMVPVIGNTPMLAVMLVLVIPIAIPAMRIAEKALKQQATKLV